MRRGRWGWWRVVALGALASVVVAPPVAAGDDDQVLDEETLNAIRQILPAGEPAEYDITEADRAFGELAELVAASTLVPEFGESSVLSGSCGGFAYSYDENGLLFDAAADIGDAAPPIDLIDGGQAFTKDNPFQVDTSGHVVYYGFSPRDGEGPHDHRWTITTSGFHIDEGGATNATGENRNAGIVDIDGRLPFDFSAKVAVTGDMTSSNLDECIGEGYVVLVGNGLLAPIGFVAMAIFVGGLVGLIVNARPARRWTA